MCGLLVESKSQGEKMDIVLGIGMNRYPVQDVVESMGWEELFSESIEELLPVIHASISSLFEIHNRIPDFSHETIMRTVYASMRCTLCETNIDAFGLDSHGGLLTKKNSILTTEELEWVWH
jgi:biotin-(acetyl-CoA carboxylase) ligase